MTLISVFIQIDFKIFVVLSVKMKNIKSIKSDLGVCLIRY